MIVRRRFAVHDDELNQVEAGPALDPATEKATYRSLKCLHLGGAARGDYHRWHSFRCARQLHISNR